MLSVSSMLCVVWCEGFWTRSFYSDGDPCEFAHTALVYLPREETAQYDEQRGVQTRIALQNAVLAGYTLTAAHAFIQGMSSCLRVFMHIATSPWKVWVHAHAHAVQGASFIPFSHSVDTILFSFEPLDPSAIILTSFAIIYLGHYLIKLQGLLNPERSLHFKSYPLKFFWNRNQYNINC